MNATAFKKPSSDCYKNLQWSKTYNNNNKKYRYAKILVNYEIAQLIKLDFNIYGQQYPTAYIVEEFYSTPCLHTSKFTYQKEKPSFKNEEILVAKFITHKPTIKFEANFYNKFYEIRKLNGNGDFFGNVYLTESDAKKLDLLFYGEVILWEGKDNKLPVKRWFESTNDSKIIHKIKYKDNAPIIKFSDFKTLTPTSEFNKKVLQKCLSFYSAGLIRRATIVWLEKEDAADILSDYYGKVIFSCASESNKVIGYKDSFKKSKTATIPLPLILEVRKYNLANTEYYNLTKHLTGESCYKKLFSKTRDKVRAWLNEDDAQGLREWNDNYPTFWGYVWINNYGSSLQEIIEPCGDSVSIITDNKLDKKINDYTARGYDDAEIYDYDYTYYQYNAAYWENYVNDISFIEIHGNSLDFGEKVKKFIKDKNV